MSVLGAMMLTPDDPLRDTPEKAEQYSRVVQSLQERLSLEKSVTPNSDRRRDLEAAVELLGGQHA